MRKTMGRGKLLTALLAIVIALGAVGIASVGLPGTAFADVDHGENSTRPQNNVQIYYGSASTAEHGDSKNIDTGEQVQFRFTVTGASQRVVDEQNGTEGFSYLELKLTNPNPDFFTFDKNTLTVTMDGNERGTANHVNRTVQGTATVDSDGSAKFVFADSELGLPGQALDPNSNLLYNSEVFTFRIMAKTPSDPNVLKNFLAFDHPGSKNAFAPISKETTGSVTWATFDDKSDKESYATRPYQNSSQYVQVYMPVLDITAANNLLTPATQNAFYTIHRKIVVFNTNANSKARGLVISDVRENNILNNVGVSVDMNSISVKKGSETVNTTNTAVNGGVTIKPAADFEIGSADQLTVEYDIVMGNINSAGFTMSKLIEALENNSVASTVRVSAANAIDAVEKTKESKLLVPEVTAAQTISCTKNLSGQTESNPSEMELTTGETAHVKIVIDPTASASGTWLINPKMAVSIPNLATIQAAGASVSNYKINGSAYTPGSVISDGTDPQTAKAKGDNVTGVVAKDNKVTFEFDVTAPSQSVALNNLGIKVNTTFNADNMTTPINGTAEFKIQIPSAQVSVNVDNRQPSAKDTVKVTAVGTISDAPASGMVLVVKDEPSNGTACKTKFQNLTVTSSAGTLTEGTDYKAYTTDNSVSIWFTKSRLIAKNEAITVTYEDTIAADSSANGAIENITARFTQNTDALATELGVSRDPSVWSNLPESVSATTDFTVQTPALVLDFKITDPVDAEGAPAVINFGDTVSYKATIKQSNPAAKGNDLVYMATIQDILIGGKEVENAETGEVTVEGGTKHSAAEVGLSFKDDIKVMSGELDVTDQYTVTLDKDKVTLMVSFKDPAAQHLGTDPIDIIFTLRTDTAPAKMADQLRGVEIGVESSAAITNLEAAASASAKIKIANAEIKLTKSAESKELRHGEAESYTLKVENAFIDPTTGKPDPNSQIRGLSIKDTLDSNSVKFGYKLDPNSFKVLLFDTSKEEGKDYAAGTYAVGSDGLEAGKYNIEFFKGIEFEAGTYNYSDLPKGQYKITFESESEEAVKMTIGTNPANESSPGAETNVTITNGMSITIPETLEENGFVRITSTVKFTLTPVEAATDVVYGKIVRADGSEEKLTSDGEIALAEGDSLVSDVKFRLAMESEGEDITKSENVKLLPSEDLSGFTFTYAKGISTSQRIAVTYEATTDGIDAGAYSQTLSNLAIASADNAKPAVAVNTVEYIGKDIEPDPEPGYPGVVETGAAAAEPQIAPTGDVTLYIIGGLIVCAVIAGGVVLFIRRKNR